MKIVDASENFTIIKRYKRYIRFIATVEFSEASTIFVQQKVLSLT